MKKFYTFFLLTLVFCMLPFYGYANIYVMGYGFSDGSKYDSSTMEGLKSGTVSYDGKEKVLILDNAVLDASDLNGSAISIFEESSFTIRLIGKSSITALNEGIYENNQEATKLTIESTDGKGSLNINAINYSGIQWNNEHEGAVLTIRNCTLEVSGEYGIKGFQNGAGTESYELVIDNATVKAKGTEIKYSWAETHHGSIVDFRTLTLKNCYIAEPSGAAYGYDDVEGSLGVYVTTSDGRKWITSDQVVILPGEPQSIGEVSPQTAKEGSLFNLAGQRINDSAKGLVVKKGRKVVR